MMLKIIFQVLLLTMTVSASLQLRLAWTTDVSSTSAYGQCVSPAVKEYDGHSYWFSVVSIQNTLSLANTSQWSSEWWIVPPTKFDLAYDSTTGDISVTCCCQMCNGVNPYLTYVTAWSLTSPQPLNSSWQLLYSQSQSDAENCPGSSCSSGCQGLWVAVADGM